MTLQKQRSERIHSNWIGLGYLGETDSVKGELYFFGII